MSLFGNLRQSFMKGWGQGYNTTVSSESVVPTTEVDNIDNIEDRAKFVVYKAGSRDDSNPAGVMLYNSNGQILRTYEFGNDPRILAQALYSPRMVGWLREFGNELTALPLIEPIAVKPGVVSPDTDMVELDLSVRLSISNTDFKSICPSGFTSPELLGLWIKEVLTYEIANARWLDFQRDTND